MVDGREAKHWHDENGNHRMPDPRILARPEPVMRDGKSTGEMTVERSKAAVCVGDPDLAAYWDHLDEHDRSVSDPNPKRQENDSPQVKALFDKLEQSEEVSATLRKLIAALRSNGE